MDQEQANQNSSINPDTSANNMTGTPTNKKIGPIVTTLIIVLVLIIAALYIFASRLNEAAYSVETPNGTEASQQTIDVQEVKQITNTADDPESLLNDLNKSTEGLDSQNF